MYYSIIRTVIWIYCYVFLNKSDFRWNLIEMLNSKAAHRIIKYLKNKSRPIWGGFCLFFLLFLIRFGAFKYLEGGIGLAVHKQVSRPACGFFDMTCFKPWYFLVSFGICIYFLCKYVQVFHYMSMVIILLIVRWGFEFLYKR